MKKERLLAPHRSHPDLDRGRASPRLQRANRPGPAWLLQPLSLVARARGPIPHDAGQPRSRPYPMLSRLLSGSSPRGVFRLWASSCANTSTSLYRSRLLPGPASLHQLLPRGRTAAARSDLKISAIAPHRPRSWKHSPELKQRLRRYAHSPPQFLLPLLKGSFRLVNY